MKNIRSMKILAFAAALCMAASMLSGCKNDSADTSQTDASAASTTAVSDEAETAVSETEPVAYGTRPVAEGDVYAINKFTVDPLPAEYQLITESQENQGKLYANGISKITVMATNYKEDFQSLDVAMETACVTIKMNNMLFQSDTEFGEVTKTKIAGFDALSRDFTITVNEFVKEDPEAEGDGVKTPVAWYKSRIVYFFSEKDVFFCVFETAKDDWDKTIGGFEEFVANISIDENAVNKPVESAAVSEEAVSEEAVSEESVSEEAVSETSAAE